MTEFKSIKVEKKVYKKLRDKKHKIFMEADKNLSFSDIIKRALEEIDEDSFSFEQ